MAAMNPQDLISLFSGSWQSNVSRAVMVVVVLGGWFALRKIFTNVDVDAAKESTDQGRADDQAQNKVDNAKVQGQLDNTQALLDQVIDAEGLKLVKPSDFGQQFVSTLHEQLMRGVKPPHVNDGCCARCLTIFSLYPGFFQPLQDWFSAFQHLHPECHISCAGRGQEAQEKCVLEHTSRAHWKESAHDWNAGLDTFVMMPGSKNIYPLDWYANVLAPDIAAHPELEWLGRKGSPYPELPHVQWRSWLSLSKQGKLKLVE